MFKKENYQIHENFLKENFYKKIHVTCKKLKYKKIYQVKKKHFSHVFKFKNNSWPKINEIWSAQYNIAINHKNNKLLNKLFYEFLIPYIKKKTNNKIKYFLFPNVYKINSGCFFRCHYDKFAGQFGYNLFLSDRWNFDDGGILHFINKNNESKMIMPEANRFILRDERKKLLHYVSEVPKYNKKSHYLILGWCSSKPGENSKIRGEYIKI